MYVYMRSRLRAAGSTVRSGERGVPGFLHFKSCEAYNLHANNTLIILFNFVITKTKSLLSKHVII